MLMKLKNPNVKEGIFFIALSAGALFMALKYHVSGNHRLSPALFPVVTTLVLMSLALALTVKSLRSAPQETAREPRGKTGNVVGVFLLCLLYTAAMEKIGFLPSTALYLLLFLLMLGEKRPVVVVLVPVLATVAVWFFFAKALSVPLP